MNLKELLISQYIDNELSIQAKGDFLDAIVRDPDYAREAKALVRQEVELSEALASAFPLNLDAPAPFRRPKSRIKPLTALGAAACVVFFLVFAWTMFRTTAPGTMPYRFVLYQPGVASVALSGSFKDWRAVPMEQKAGSGYWELSLDLPPGEYRFSYLVGETLSLPDPTLLAREVDDFGGVNSILTVEKRS